MSSKRPAAEPIKDAIEKRIALLGGGGQTFIDSDCLRAMRSIEEKTIELARLIQHESARQNADIGRTIAALDTLTHAKDIALQAFRMNRVYEQPKEEPMGRATDL